MKRGINVLFFHSYLLNHNNNEPTLTTNDYYRGVFGFSNLEK